jgi:hypothetical protein
LSGNRFGLFAGDDVFKQLQALVERAQERAFLLTDHVHDKILLRTDLGKRIAHLCSERFDKLVDERSAGSEERETITYRTTQDPADDIASAGV